MRRSAAATTLMARIDSLAANSISVAGVVCLYRPRLDELDRLLDAVLPQVTALWLVDDGTPEPERTSLRAFVAGWLGKSSQLNIRYLERNSGLAAALNRGIEAVRDNDPCLTHCLLLDQDSVPAADMVRQLLRAEAQLTDCDHRVAAVGPALEDRAGRTLVVSAGRSVLPAIDRVDLLPTSGTLVRLSVFTSVGLMDESLFIDNVDLDWCYRSAALGKAIFRANDARLSHCIGERKRIAGCLDVVTHGPDRLYYMTRNRIRLYRRSHTPWQWIARDIPRLLGKTLLFGCFVAPRLDYVRAVLGGLVDGARDVGGRRS